jgi:hypothetical protein
MRTTSAKGYYRHQFEQAWRSYCDGQAADGTPSEPSVIRQLRSGAAS